MNYLEYHLEKLGMEMTTGPTPNGETDEWKLSGLVAIQVDGSRYVGTAYFIAVEKWPLQHLDRNEE